MDGYRRPAPSRAIKSTNIFRVEHRRRRRGARGAQRPQGRRAVVHRSVRRRQVDAGDGARAGSVPQGLPGLRAGRRQRPPRPELRSRLLAGGPRREHPPRRRGRRRCSPMPASSCITAFISPYRADRDRVRAMAPELFHEIYIDADVGTCEQRDPKGLYKKARKGEIDEFTGISAPYEPPIQPEVRIDTGRHSVEDCLAQLDAYVSSNFAMTRHEKSRRRDGRSAAATFYITAGGGAASVRDVIEVLRGGHTIATDRPPGHPLRRRGDPSLAAIAGAAAKAASAAGLRTQHAAGDGAAGQRRGLRRAGDHRQRGASVSDCGAGARAGGHAARHRSRAGGPQYRARCDGGCLAARRRRPGRDHRVAAVGPRGRRYGEIPCGIPGSDRCCEHWRPGHLRHSGKPAGDWLRLHPQGQAVAGNRGLLAHRPLRREAGPGDRRVLCRIGRLRLEQRHVRAAGADAARRGGAAAARDAGGAAARRCGDATSDLDFLRLARVPFVAAPSHLHRLCGDGAHRQGRRGRCRDGLERRRLMVGAVGDQQEGQRRQRPGRRRAGAGRHATATSAATATWSPPSASTIW